MQQLSRAAKGLQRWLGPRPATPRVVCGSNSVVYHERPTAPAPVDVLSPQESLYLDPQFLEYRQATTRLVEAEDDLGSFLSTLQRMDEADDMEQVFYTPPRSLEDAAARKAARQARRDQRQGLAASGTVAHVLQQQEAKVDEAVESLTQEKERLESLFASPAVAPAETPSRSARRSRRSTDAAAAAPAKVMESTAAAPEASTLGLDVFRLREGETSLLPAGPSLPASARELSSRRSKQHGRAQGRSAASANRGTGGGASDSMSVFMKNASNSDLLNSTNEKDLALLVKDYLFLQKSNMQLRSVLKREPTDAECAQLVQMEESAFRSRLSFGRSAKTMLLQSNYRLVISIVKKYQNRGMSMQDMVTEGMNGLLKGVEKFDPTKGFRFSTYAHWWIRQAVTRSLSEQGRTVRIPTHITEQLSKLAMVRNQLQAELGREPTPAELEAKSGIPRNKLAEWTALSRQPASLDVAVMDDDNAQDMKDMLVDERATPDEVMGDVMLSRDLEEILATLNEREAGVIKLRFGLTGQGEMTLEEIGDAFSVTRERIRQIEAKAVRKLKARSPELDKMLMQYAQAQGMSLREAGGRSSRGTKKT